MSKWIQGAMGGVALALAAVALPAQAGSLALTASGATAPLNGEALVTLQLDVTGAYELSGGGFTIDFDSSALSLVTAHSSAGGISFDDWASAGVLLGNPVFSVTPGVVGLSVLLPSNQTITDQSLPIVLAFKGLSVGTSAVSYDVAPMDASFAETRFTGQVDVHITAVPEPATYALMLAGVVAVGAAAARRRKA